MPAAPLTILSVIFVTLWSSGWVVSRFAVDDLSAMTLLTTRYAIVFLIALILVTVLGHWRRLSLGTVTCHLLIGMLSHGTYLLAALGAFELGVSAALVAFVTALQPMIIAVLSGPITHESISHRQWQGLLIGLCAVLLLISDSYLQGQSGYALSLPFVSVLALSIGTLLNRRLELNDQRMLRRATPVTLVLLLHSIGALCLLIPISASYKLLQFSFSSTEWAILAWLALVVSLGAYGVLQILVRHISGMQVSSLTYLVPPATMIQAYLVFGDTIGLTDVAGLLIAAGGVFLVMKPTQQRTKHPCAFKIHRQIDIEL